MFTPALVPFIEGFEKFEANAYYDKLGMVWTVGYGCTGPGIISGTVWSLDQARSALHTRLVGFNGMLNILTDLTNPVSSWPTGAEDALTDFLYNVGPGNYKTSTLRMEVNAGNWNAVKPQIMRWNHAQGEVVDGLTRRRQGECDMIVLPS